MPNDKFENFEFAEEFIRPIVREVPLNGFPFKGWGKKQQIRCPLSFYYFLQPSFTDLIAIKHGESSLSYSDSFRQINNGHQQERMMLAARISSQGIPV